MITTAIGFSYPEKIKNNVHTKIAFMTKNLKKNVNQKMSIQAGKLMTI